MQPTSWPRRRGQQGKSPDTLPRTERAKGLLARIQPAGVRAVCDQLFVNKWLRSMKTVDTNTVSKPLVWAREQDEERPYHMPWKWMVDETRPESRPPLNVRLTEGVWTLVVGLAFVWMLAWWGWSQLRRRFT